MNRETIIEQIRSAICKDRLETYGPPEDSFTCIKELWHTYLSHSKRPLASSDVSVLMILLKIARIAKSPQHMDNWMDAGGYAICGGEVAFREYNGKDEQPLVCTTPEFVQLPPERIFCEYLPIEYDFLWGAWCGAGWYLITEHTQVISGPYEHYILEENRVMG